MRDLDRTPTEQALNRGYLVQTIVSYIGALGFSINLASAAVELCDGHFAGLLGRVGVAAFTAAVWFSGAYRAGLLRRRVTEGRLVDLLLQPRNWLPSPFGFARAAIGNDSVQLLPPSNR